MPETKSVRRIALERIMERASNIRNGRYYVHRGGVDWAQFPWAQHRHAIAVLMDRATFMKRDGIQRATVTVVMACQMEELQDAIPKVSDAVMDEYFEDMEQILLPLRNERVAKNAKTGDSLFLKLNDEAEIIEFNDAIFRTQGVVCTMQLEY